MTKSCIVGWAHSRFGKLDEPDVEALIASVAGAAIADAGIAPAEIDAVFVGLFNNGFSRQDFPASLVLQSVPELRFKPASRHENACASGSAAVHGARDFLAAGRGRFALVIGAEKMTATPGPQIGDNLLGAAYRREEGRFRRASPVCSAASRSSIFSGLATSPTRWRQLRPRTTATGWTTPMPRCAATWASRSAAPRARRTRSWRRR